MSLSPAKGHVWLKLRGGLFPEMFNLSHAHNCFEFDDIVCCNVARYVRTYIFLKGLQVVLLSTHHITYMHTNRFISLRKTYLQNCVIDAVELHGTLVLAVVVVLHVH